MNSMAHFIVWQLCALVLGKVENNLMDMFWYENGKRQSHKNCGSEQEQMGFLSYRSGALSSTTALKATKNAHPQNRDFVNRHAAKKHAQVPRTHMTNEIGM